MGEALFERFPQAREGQLSRLRARLVKGETLAILARGFDLQDHALSLYAVCTKPACPHKAK